MFKGLLLFAAAYVLLRWRERVVEIVGKVPWAEHYLGRGGSYTLMVLLAFGCFIMGLLTITGTTYLLFAPFKQLTGGGY